jgi:hypothetical protein
MCELQIGDTRGITEAADAVGERNATLTRLPPTTRKLPGTAAAMLLAVLALSCASAVAMTSHVGWPPDQHLMMDKGPAGEHHVLRGAADVHNYLLGGYGDDTIYGGNAGDVIWGDYHPSGESTQTAIIHAGNGKNFIYANDTFNYVWTGTNPATVVHAHEDAGIIHCESPSIVIYTSHRAKPHWKFEGCRHISFYSVGY